MPATHAVAGTTVGGSDLLAMNLLAVGTRENRTGRIQVLDSRGDVRFDMKASGTVHCLALQPGGDGVASGLGCNWWMKESGESGGYERVHKGHSGAVRCIAHSPCGRKVATGGEDNCAKVWDAASGAETAQLMGHTAPVQAVAFSAAGTVATGSLDTSIRVFDCESGEPLSVIFNAHANSLTGLGGVFSLCMSPDGRSIVSGGYDHFIRVWDTATGAQVRALGGHSDLVCSVALSPDSRLIASGSFDLSVRLWDAETGAARLAFRGHDSCFGCDCERYAPANPRCGLPGHRDYVMSVAFSADGAALVSGSYDGLCKVWDLRAGALHASRAMGHPVFAVALAPDVARRRRLEAFAMGQHARLGAASPVQLLTDDILCILLDWAC